MFKFTEQISERVSQKTSMKVTGALLFAGTAPNFLPKFSSSKSYPFFLKGLIPDLDIITYGPIAEGCHTPEEKLNLESFQKAYKNLCDLIAEL